MAMSGIAVSAELKADFLAIQGDASVFCVQVGVNRKATKFVKQQVVNTTQDKKADFQAMQAVMDSRLPCYAIFRSPRVAQKWVCLFYCPSSAPVRQRMVFASSVNSLKSGFGSSLFAGDYHATSESEVALNEYLGTFEELDREAVMTFDEVEAERAEHESARMASRGATKTQVEIPIKIDDQVLGSLQEHKAGSISTVVLKIAKNETVCRVDSGTFSFDEVTAFMLDKKPRYIVHTHNYSHEETKMNKVLFIYYCPEGAKPKHKMMYAAVKSKVVQLCAAAEITNMRNLEFTDKKDCTEQSIYLDLHPPVVNEVKFVKAAAKGRSKRGRHNKKKFVARRK